jgi:DNA-binding HxlR family transcriptional regulator
VTTFDHATTVLISRRYVVEVLARLHECPQTRRALHRSCHGTNRDLHDALRALAAAGAVHRTGTGASWDNRHAGEAAYALTAAGQRLVEHLSDIDTWTETYQRYLDQPERLPNPGIA